MGFLTEFRTINELLKKEHDVVFYSEAGNYFTYFERIITELQSKGVKDILYVTSDKNDPLLTENRGMRVEYVKWMLGTFFSKLKAKLVIMTMPDLGNFLFKRSRDVGEYIYVFHAAVSTHQQYRKSAFYNYDSFFCTGPYQVEEIRTTEVLRGQKEKKLLPFGYPLFEAIRKKSRSADLSTPTLLVAPSWFEGCIFDTCLLELIEVLKPLPYRILLRAHPEYRKRNKREYARIRAMSGTPNNIIIDTNPDVSDSLAQAQVLVTDRSGIALEFAFGCGRPVIYIDTNPKEINPDWKELGMEPIENRLRQVTGEVISLKKLSTLPAAIEELQRDIPQFVSKMEEVGKECFFHFPGFNPEGIQYILQKLETD